MIDVAAAANEMELPEEGAIFPMATPVLATPAAFMGGHCDLLRRRRRLRGRPQRITPTVP
ncbi:hypothetical protein ACH4VR_15055 [Streptomyces sp. NPDC020883]|uniref:hypothetical protein n=1 Tax=Streptomyces sp. NPDC020883 TaxID=3365099 RepID=UPI0037ACC02D